MKKRLAGYFTVEATLILMFVFTVFVFTFSMGFYQYNRCIMQQNAYRIALRGSGFYRGSNKEVLMVCEKTKDILTSDRYILLECESEIEVSGKVVVNLFGKMKLLAGSQFMPGGRNHAKIEVVAESKCMNPVLFVRAYRDLYQSRKEEK